MTKFLLSLATLCLAIIAISVAYYFLYFLPRADAANTLSENQTACAKLETEVRAGYAQNLYADGLVSYLSSSNHYNQKLHECIVDIASDWNTPGGGTRDDVLDALENKVILRCYELNVNGKETNNCSDENGAISYDQFNSMENQLLSQ